MTLVNLTARNWEQGLVIPSQASKWVLFGHSFNACQLLPNSLLYPPNHLDLCPQNPLHSPQTPLPPLNLLLPSSYHQSLSIYTTGLTSATSIHVCPSHTSLTRFLLLVSGLHDLSQSLLHVIKFRFHNRNTICKPKYVLNFHLFNEYSLGTYCVRV